jgi:4-diphosphocytidyl-2-C-methyl-D-erythritol kinase
MIRERAFAKVNLVLHVGPPRGDGMHPVCSLFASIDLADDVVVEPAVRDEVACPGVVGANLCQEALDGFRRAVELPPVRVTIEKRIPIAAGLGGGSADAGAVLRAANELAGRPLDADGLRELAAGLGSDVPSQVEPQHTLVGGYGERVEPIDLPPLSLVLVPAAEGVLTREVYAELDRLGGTRDSLDPARLRGLAASPLQELAAGVENDLQPAAVSLRPELDGTLSALRERGARAAAVGGSGPTAFGLFGDAGAAERAAGEIPRALVARGRNTR